MVNKNNYFEASKGVFKALPKSWVEKLLSRRFWRDEEEGVKLGNHKWFPNFISTSRFWGSASLYWTSEDGQYLIRVSDHWSLSSKRVKTCGNIRKCFWALSGKPKSWCYHPDLEVCVNPMWGGLIKFSDMKER